MVVWEVNQEQESANVRYARKILGPSKTRTVDLAVRLSYRSTVQKTVGLLGQLHLLSATTVLKRSRLPKARTNNTAIWNVVIRGILIKPVNKLELGKVITLLTQRFTNGFRRITKSLVYVTTAKKMAIQNGLIYHKTITEKEKTGLTYANPVTSTLMVTIKHSDVISDVIRKRYHKFVTGSEEGWQDGTPRIGVQ
jgi:hypothetical protein